MKRKLPSLDKRYKKHRPLTEDEAELWRAALEVKSSSDFRGRSEEADKKQARSLPDPSTRKEKDPGNAPKPALSAVLLSHLDKPSLMRIRRGSVSIEATLDLHSHSKASAHLAVLRFIADARERGLRLVLVITGKGRKGGGALREEFPRWLSESPLREAIIAYDNASPRHGGEGAWYVRIRK